MSRVPPDGGSEESVTEMATTLRHERRRDLVRHLRSDGGAASVTALAFRVAATTEADLPDAMASLQDLDLPRLVECGLVEVDRESERVELAAGREQVERALERARRQ